MSTSIGNAFITDFGETKEGKMPKHGSKSKSSGNNKKASFVRAARNMVQRKKKDKSTSKKS